MFKLISAALITTTLLFSCIDYLKPAIAGTCATNCPPKPLQFTPGKPIRLEVVNNTSNIVQIQKPSATRTIPLERKQQITLESLFGTEPNVSLVFWDETGLAIRAIISKPNFATLRVELRPGGRNGGDRSVYIRNDGRVDVL